MGMVKMGQRTITPDEYELTLMDTRYVDKTLWKPVSAANREAASNAGKQYNTLC